MWEVCTDLPFVYGVEMPNYTFRDEEGKEYTINLTISQYEKYKKTHTNHKQVLFPNPYGDSVRLGIRKHDNNFNDVLKNVKSHHAHSTIETR